MYKEFNDYELVYLVKENNEDGFNILYKKYMPLMIKFANKYINSFKYFGYDKDDLMQIGYFTLYKAAKYYRLYSESMFYTFLCTLLENDFNQEYRKCNTNKHKSLNKSFSYDSVIPGTELTYKEIIGDYNTYLDDMDIYNKYVLCKNNLPFEISCYMELKYNGYSNKEICLLLDVDYRKVIEYQAIIKKNYLYT